jgi:hypothetical protein
MASFSRAGMTHMDTLATFHRFADMTGGKAYYNTNDLVGAFKQAADDSSAYYMLGFYLDLKAATKTGWHKLQVKVRTAGAHVRARNGFYVTGATQDASLSKPTDMAMALSSPLEFTAVPFSGRWTGVVAAPAGKKRVRFELVLPARLNLVDTTGNNHLQLEIDAIARTASGDTAASFGKTVDAHLKPESLQQVNNDGITYMGDLDLPPGDYSVRFVIRDDVSGRMGTVTAPVKVAP